MRISKIIRFAVALLTMSLLLPSNAQAGLNYVITASSVTWPGQTGNGYSVFDASAYPYTANFSITKIPLGGRNYYVTFSRNSSGNYSRVLKSGLNQINYQLYQVPGLTTVLKEQPEATSSEVISGQSPNTALANIPLSFIVHLPPGQVLAPGTYTDSVTLRVYDGTYPNGVLEDSATITISAQVRAVADLSLVSSSSSFSTSTSKALSFGELSPGLSLGCDLRVRSNVSYIIAFASQNRGVLKSGTLASTIPYTMTIRGQPLDLTLVQTTFASTSPNITDSNGQVYPLAVTIGNFSNPSAGTYTDVVTITVTTN